MATASVVGQAPAAMPPMDIHILLVDDERLSRVVVANLLRKCNYQVTVAESGGQALELLQQEPRQFHLLLTDVMMPQVGGIELLRYVRSHQELVDMPVIMMSASEQAETVTECIRGGAEEYLVKPVTQKEVQKIWTHVVKRNASSSGAGPVGLVKTVAPIAVAAAIGSGTAQQLQNRPSANGRASAAQAAGSGVTPPTANGVVGTTAAADSPQSRLSPTPVAAGEAKVDAEGRAPSKRASKRAVRNGAASQAGAGRVVSMSLRQWISRPGRSADSSKTAELLWIFAETILLVERWHQEHGTGCGRVRPSQLLLHSNGTVTLAPSLQPAQQQQDGQQQELQQSLQLKAEPATVTAAAGQQQLEESVPVANGSSGMHGAVGMIVDTHVEGGKQHVAEVAQAVSQAAVHTSRRAHEIGAVLQDEKGNQCLLHGQHTANGTQHNSNNGKAVIVGNATSDCVEEQLYHSPELSPGAAPTPLSDVFQLGLLFFELLYTVAGQDTLGSHWKDKLRDARDRHLPAALLQARPEESALLLQMLHHEPSSRLGPSDLQNQGILKRALTAVRSRHAMQTAGNNAQRKAVVKAATQEANWQKHIDQVVLSDFLRMMYSRKRAELTAVESTIKALEQDMSLLEQLLAARRTTARRRMEVSPLVSPKLGATSLLQSSSSLPVPAGSRLANGGSPGVESGRAASNGTCAHGSGLQAARTMSLNTAGSAQQALALRTTSRSCSFCKAATCQGTCGKDGQQAMDVDVHPSPKAVQVPSSPGLSRGVAKQGEPCKGWTAAGAANEDLEPMQVAQNRWQAMNGQHAALQDLYLRVRTQAASHADDSGIAAPPSKRSRTGDAPANAPARPSTPSAPQQPSPATVADPASAARSERATNLPSYMQQFCEDLSGYSRYTRLELLASMQQGDALSSSNMVCSVAFDRDDEFFATAGVSRRIRIYELASAMRGAVVGNAYPVLDISTRSRLSSVCWSGYVKSHLAAADYEGMVVVWDVNTHTELLQYEEHGKRVWAVDFSRLDPTRLASAADDSTVKLWSISQEHSTATINCGANVCSVQWSPHSPHLLACGTADCRALLYDIRNLSEPVVCISDHTKAVSYVRHASVPDQLLTASTDSAVRRWKLPQSMVQDAGITAGKRHGVGLSAVGPTTASGQEAKAGDKVDVEQPTCVMTYTGHTNVRNFVGLSVSMDGYIACGSEDNSLVCYYQALPFPALAHRFTDASSDVGDFHEQVSAGGASRDQVAQSGGPPAFVSSVSWAQHSNLLLAANSLGVIHVLQLA